MSGKKQTRFSLSTIFVVVAVCCLLFSSARGYWLQSIGRKHWHQLCKESSESPTSLQENIDQYIRLKELGLLTVPSEGFLWSEFYSFERAYTGNLQAMEPAEFLESVDQFEHMLNSLASLIVGRSDRVPLQAFRYQLSRIALDVVHNAAKTIETELNDTIVIAAPDDGKSKVNQMIAGIEAVKARYMKSPIFAGDDLERDLRWQNMLIPVCLPIIKNDLIVIRRCEMETSKSASGTFIEPYSKRLRTCQELCGFDQSAEGPWY